MTFPLGYRGKDFGAETGAAPGRTARLRQGYGGQAGKPSLLQEAWEVLAPIDQINHNKK